MFPYNLRARGMSKKKKKEGEYDAHVLSRLTHYCSGKKIKRRSKGEWVSEGGRVYLKGKERKTTL